jgi:glycosyltransferase involved in cell wall biosynthesis
VASSNAASLPEVCGDAARLFDPQDPQAIAEAILDVVGAPEEWRQRGFKRAAAFTWTASAAAHEAVYRELL